MILNTGKRVIGYLEDQAKPFYYFIFTFLFVAMTRSFLEFFAYGAPVEFKFYAHFFLFYASIVISLILFFSVATNSEVIKVARVILGSFFIILIGPVFDLIFGYGSKKNLTYFLPGYHDNLTWRFFTFGGNFSGTGVSWGVRLELALILLLSFIYFYIKTEKLIKSLFNTFVTYIILFTYWSFVLMVHRFADALHLKIDYTGGGVFNQFFLMIIFMQVSVLLYISGKNIFRIIVKNARFSRLLHYELLLILGAVFGLANLSLVDPHNLYRLSSINIANVIISLPVICASIFFASVYSTISNDIEDLNIDLVSNKGRPLASGEVGLNLYHRISWFFLVLALSYALAVDFFVFALITILIGNYFLYSLPPLRLKRITFFSKAAIGFNSLLLLMLGFRITTGDFRNFPPGIVMLCLIGFTAAANFIDIKDYAGDKKAGIKTLPVVLGLAKAKFYIGLFFVLNYLAVIFLFQEFYTRFALCVFGLLQFFLLNRKDFDERPVFFVHLLSIAAVIIYFFTLI